MKNVVKFLKELTTDEALDFLYQNFDLNLMESRRFFKTDSKYISDDDVESGLIDYQKEVELIEFTEKNNPDHIIYVVSFFGGKKVFLYYYLNELKARKKYSRIIFENQYRFAEIVSTDDEIKKRLGIIDDVLTKVKEAILNNYSTSECKGCGHYTNLDVLFNVQLSDGKRLYPCNRVNTHQV
ncbi:MAG: hypothetical protein IJ085_06950, partial [Turicibacter sp.]|nr:hypothetical protein [Turicibacter sp.]